MIQISNILEVQAHIDGLDTVVFDLDDTLYPEKAYIRSGYACIGAAFPQIERMAEKLWQVFLRGGKAIDEVLAAEVITDLAVKDICLNLYRTQVPDIRLYPGVTELLKRLRSKGLKLGIITDGRPEGQNAKLDALGLRELVDEIIITDSLGGIQFRKPNELAFRLMREKLCTSFQKMAYVGDNSNKDFVAPEKLGMRAIHFVNPDGLYI